MTRRWKIGVGGALLTLTLVIAIAVGFGRPMLEIATGYKAKMLCSEVFVAGRAPADVVAELESQDLTALRFISASIDHRTRTATVRAPLGIMTREARFRDSGGCLLAFDRQPPPAAADQPRNEPAPSATDLASSQGTEMKTRLTAVLDDAFSETDRTRPRQTRAIVLMSNGQIVAERYATGFTAATPMLGWSMAKSVVNALAGILVGHGRLALDAPVRVPLWSAPDDPRNRITLDHLLRMSSGLRFDEEMTKPVTDILTALFRIPDMAAFAADKPLEAAPGTRWQYSSGTSLILSGVIRSVLGDVEYRTFPRAALFDPIGMSSAVLETDATGTFAASSFMYATAGDWARLGQLYLQDGVWNGSRILPEGWVTYSRTPAPAHPTGAYGAHFWLQIPEEYGASHAPLPNDAFHAAGHEGQFVTIIPSRQVVIVRLGKTRYGGVWDQSAFVSNVLRALAPVAGSPGSR
ncbi:MAG TPA: serine hydrolase [Vicinamibacterales bacterium]|nr:serine hydrolase [Vicinamibacterales bacterium]